MEINNIGDSARRINISVKNSRITVDNQDNINEIQKISEEFEAIFLQFMLKSMRETVPKNGLIGKGNGEEIFRSMLDSQYAKEMSKQGSSGIARAVRKQLIDMIDQTNNSFNSQGGHKNIPTIKQTI